MSRLYDTELDEQEDKASGEDREISLGTATILGIFFALALVCAGFFGFGYTLGRKSAQNAPAPAPASAGNYSGLKPAAGSTAADAAPVPANAQVADVAAPPDLPAPAPAKGSVAPAATVIVGDPVPAAPLKQSAPAPVVAAPAPPISPGGAFMVQVAAVSSQDVADILLASLRKKGYSVAVRSEPQDKLLHVQIGPFATRKDADAMRDKVLSDGFNAIVK